MQRQRLRRYWLRGPPPASDALVGPMHAAATAASILAAWATTRVGCSGWAHACSGNGCVDTGCVGHHPRRMLWLGPCMQRQRLRRYWLRGPPPASDALVGPMHAAATA